MRKLIGLSSIVVLAGIAGHALANNAAANPVDVSLSNLITVSDKLALEYTEFKSTDIFDQGTRNYQPIGTVTHTYQAGPKNIKYGIKLRALIGVEPNFKQCSYIKLAANCTSYTEGNYEHYSCNTDAISTGNAKSVHMKFSIDANQNVTCTLT